MTIASDLDRKIVDLLGDLTIDKEQVRNLRIRDARTVTTFVEEWLVSRYERPDKTAAAVYQDITAFMSQHLSRHVWLNSGGALTRAQLFKNLSTKEEGLLARFDLLVLDEGQSIEFKGEGDIHAKFKDFLESGHYTIGHDKITSECGLMVLANIELDYRGVPARPDFIRQLPEMFHDDALLDRFHGILAGWKIPRINNAHFAQGPGIKADVFGEYAHQIRTASQAVFPYGQVPSMKGDTRDSKAIERLARALSRLFMLNPDQPDYDDYVLNPAIALRERVRSQLAALNPSEFSPGVEMDIAEH